MSLILLVEDDELIRSITAEVLCDTGHKVLQAASAEEAAQLLAGSHVDVLIADLGLPGTPGEVFAAEAKAAQSGLRVVFVTGGSAITDHADEGGPPVLRKPYSRDALLDALDRAR